MTLVFDEAQIPAQCIRYYCKSLYSFRKETINVGRKVNELLRSNFYIVSSRKMKCNSISVENRKPSNEYGPRLEICECSDGI